MPSESLALGSFLKEEDLVHLHDVLESHGGLAELASMLSANRVLFLARLKEWGVSRLVERQRVANGLPSNLAQRADSHPAHLCVRRTQARASQRPDRDQDRPYAAVYSFCLAYIITGWMGRSGPPRRVFPSLHAGIFTAEKEKFPSPLE